MAVRALDSKAGWAVTLRSVVSFLSDEGTRDGAFGHKDDFGGDLFEKFDLYRTAKHLVESLDWQVYWLSKYLDGRADTVPECH